MRMQERVKKVTVTNIWDLNPKPADSCYRFFKRIVFGTQGPVLGGNGGKGRTENYWEKTI